MRVYLSVFYRNRGFRGEAPNDIRKNLSQGCSILAEIGTLHLEYSELTEHFNDPSYLQKVTTVRDVLQSTPRDHDKLYPVYIHPTTKQWGQKLVSVGALGDSFYEYLLKERLIVIAQQSAKLLIAVLSILLSSDSSDLPGSNSSHP